MEWYDAASGHVERIATTNGWGLVPAVASLAHLSPRVSWKQNLVLLDLLLSDAPKPAACLTATWERARGALASIDPLDSFGPSARKTRNFALAILGDRNAIVLDVWAARAAGVEEAVVRRATGYVAVAEAYRRAGRRVGLSGRDIQAVTWCAQRGKAA